VDLKPRKETMVSNLETTIKYWGKVRTEPYPTDYLLNKTILPLIPYWLKPNHLTIFRFLATPFVFWLFWQGNYQWGLPVFLLVAFTDALDGALARIRKQITQWGITYDPVADKILMGGVVLILVLQKLGKGLALVIVGSEVIAILGGLYFKMKGVLCPATIWGKIKMNIQVLAITILLIGVIFNASYLFNCSYWLFVISLGFALMSILGRGQ
jgi:CDP-diacylglycerol--glycerol-3-phosphate 3-phosphatidyltransferase